MNEAEANPSMPEAGKCPQCGTPLPAVALAGLCPACLLKQGAAADTVTDGERALFDAPPIAELVPLFPQLEILELIGKGGMGAVYRARQKELDRLVALKILPPGIGDDPAFAERFAREARALARLNHPGIVTLFEFGKSDGLYFFLMEFVDGVNLRQLLHSGRVSPREALAIVPQICDALQFAHDQGIVHRDIKPENVLLDRRGHVKVADFGLAKIVGVNAPLTRSLTPSDGGRVAKLGEGNPALTGPGKVMGTPQYMAPEQVDHPTDVDHRADIYALGVVFYQMLTGELPGKPIKPPSKKVQIDVRLDKVVLRALEGKPELRYQQASVLKTQLETIAATPQPSLGSSPEESSLGLGSPQTRMDERAAAGMGALTEPRFSRAALVGAIWIALFFLNWLVSYTPPGWAVTGLFRKSPWNLVTELLIFLPLTVLGFAALPGGSAMGIVALHQIRRARGTVRGFALAVFDLLFFPLLLLNGWLVWLAWRVTSQVGSASLVVIGLFLLVGLALNWFLVRAVTRNARHFVRTSAPPARPSVTGTWSQVSKALALRLVLVIAVHLALLETLEQISVHWKESTEELWGMALAVATLGGLGWACWPSYRLKRSWLLCAGGTVVSSLLLLGLDNLYSWQLRPNLGLYREADWVAQHPGFQRQLRERIERNLWRRPADDLTALRECVIPDFEALEPPQVLRLLTGEVGDVPVELFKENNWAAIRDWATTNRVLAFINLGGNTRALSCDGWRFGGLPETAWDRALPADIDAALAAGTKVLEFRRLEGTKTAFEIPADVHLPLYLAFETSLGDRGLMQIVQISRQPRSMKIRYKLVRPQPER